MSRKSLPGPFRADAACGSLRSPVRTERTIRAVLFDLDGTLYAQRPLRALMGAELALFALRHPQRGSRVMRAIAAYRRAQEQLRGANARAVASWQLGAAATASGVPLAEMSQIVGEWMLQRPLKYLRACRAAGVLDLLMMLQSQQVQLGVLSDYPPDDKLRALGLSSFFPLTLCASSPEIGAFKPSPAGFLLACDRWGLSPEDVLVVGDRLDADAAGAEAAGMDCVVLGRVGRAVPLPANCVCVSSMERLRRVLDRSR